MLNIVTIQWGNYHGMGKEYVERLFAAVDRNLRGVEYRKVCFTDKPDWVPAGVEARELPPDIMGFWNKINLFQKGHFPDGDRIVYLDLSLLPVGRLHDIVTYDGTMAMLRDFTVKERLASGMMLWTANTQNDIWDIWDRGGRPQFHPEGDQRWIEQFATGAGALQDFFANQLVSYKVDCLKGLPASARVVAFHGNPKPHMLKDVPWVLQNWRT